MKKKALICFLIMMLIGSSFLIGCSGSKKSGTHSYNISLSDTEVTIEVGEQKKINASYGGGIKVEFKSTDESIATVSADGLITALKVGEAYIDVSADGKVKTCKVNAVQYEYSVVLDTDNITLILGTKKEINASVFRNDEKITDTVLWTVSPEKDILTVVSNTIVFDSQEKGIFTITATYKGASSIIVFTVVGTDDIQ